MFILIIYKTTCKLLVNKCKIGNEFIFFCLDFSVHYIFIGIRSMGINLIVSNIKKMEECNSYFEQNVSN